MLDSEMRRGYKETGNGVQTTRQEAREAGIVRGLCTRVGVSDVQAMIVVREWCRKRRVTSPWMNPCSCELGMPKCRPASFLCDITSFLRIIMTCF